MKYIFGDQLDGDTATESTRTLVYEDFENKITKGAIHLKTQVIIEKKRILIRLGKSYMVIHQTEEEINKIKELL